MQYVLWAVSFVSLWLSILWLSVAFFGQDAPIRMCTPKETVSIAIPVLNGAKGSRRGIVRTLESIQQLDYPQELLQIIVVDDKSSDNTLQIVRQFMNSHKNMNITLLRHKVNKGKGAAVNSALEQASGTFFAVLDCDSRVASNCIRISLSLFDSPRIGAVIPSIKVDDPKNIYEKLQRVEYILSDLIRQLFGKMGTLFFSHGVLCIFRTRVVRSLGGFDGSRENLTEDLEMGLRLRAHHYDIKMSQHSLGYTFVPDTFRKLWRQRVRWFRGFLYNHLKYRRLIGNPDYGLLGLFQLPLNVISVVLLLVTMGFVSYGVIDSWTTFVARSLSVNGYFLNHVLDFPNLKEVLIGQNVQVLLPILLGSALGLWILVLAHRRMKEKLLRHAIQIWLYIIVGPYLTCMHWIASLAHDLLRTKKKW